MTADARTFLFVPGDRPDRFGKAVWSGADVVILDLEDAVTADRKEGAREHADRWLQGRHTAILRINGADTRWHDDDVAMAAEHPGTVSSVMVPKAEDLHSLNSVASRLPPETGIIPLIETAVGITLATPLCGLPRVIRPAFGSLDLAAQLGIDHHDRRALDYARSALAIAAAAAGCAAPIDGVTTDIGDNAILQEDLEHAVSLGFTGKLCIHPSQVAAANKLLTPSEADISWARGVMATAQDGSVGVHGAQMVDRPVILRAQAILARATRIGQEA